MEENVLRGIELLDRQVPGWRDRIDWDRLDMMYGANRCILAQLFGSYGLGRDRLNVLNYYYYGFDVPQMKPTLNDYNQLTELWRQAAKACPERSRRATGGKEG